MFECPKCGEEIPENKGKLECQRCGLKILMMRCPKCDRLLPVRIEEKIEVMKCKKCRETLYVYPEKAYWRTIND